MYSSKREYFLKHHGIQGQKWGVRNGPPYPLDDKTAKKVKKSLEKSINKSKNKDFSESIKKVRENEFYSKVQNFENVVKAKRALEEFDKDYKDYDKQREKFLKIYADVMKNNLDLFSLEWTQDENDKEWNWGDDDYYIHALETDGDYGVNSFTLYLANKKESISSYKERLKNTEERFHSETNKAVETILGKNKDLTLKSNVYYKDKSIEKWIDIAARDEIKNYSYFYLQPYNDEPTSTYKAAKKGIKNQIKKVESEMDRLDRTGDPNKVYDVKEVERLELMDLLKYLKD